MYNDDEVDDCAQQRDSTYDSECASSFLIQHLTDSLHMDYGDVNGSIPNHQSNMGLSRYCGNQSRYESLCFCFHFFFVLGPFRLSLFLSLFFLPRSASTL